MVKLDVFLDRSQDSVEDKGAGLLPLAIIVLLKSLHHCLVVEVHLFLGRTRLLLISGN
jgi:hypothetical protein